MIRWWVVREGVLSKLFEIEQHCMQARVILVLDDTLRPPNIAYTAFLARRILERDPFGLNERTL